MELQREIETIPIFESVPAFTLCGKNCRLDRQKANNPEDGTWNKQLLPLQ